jgi:hypothetical protein
MRLAPVLRLLSVKDRVSFLQLFSQDWNEPQMFGERYDLIEGMTVRAKQWMKRCKPK